MVQRSPEVDAYVAAAPAFAQPILKRIRAAFHAGCPELEERLKWRVPSFEYKGLLGGMVYFKEYVAFGFWKSRLMEDFHRDFSREPRASMMGARVTKVAELPSKDVLVTYVRYAKKLNDEGIKEPKLARKKGTLKVTVPADLKAALAKNAKARATFEGFPPSARRDYVEWITTAVQATTRKQRLATTVEWLAEGKRRNWKYEKRS